MWPINFHEHVDNLTMVITEIQDTEGVYTISKDGEAVAVLMSYEYYCMLNSAARIDYAPQFGEEET
jgi:prevent-host-death family protein